MSALDVLSVELVRIGGKRKETRRSRVVGACDRFWLVQWTCGGDERSAAARTVPMPWFKATTVKAGFDRRSGFGTGDAAGWRLTATSLGVLAERIRVGCSSCASRSWRRAGDLAICTACPSCGVPLERLEPRRHYKARARAARDRASTT